VPEIFEAGTVEKLLAKYPDREADIRRYGCVEGLEGMG
jgi:hypothetical protein